jgi:hypothetical protein
VGETVVTAQAESRPPLRIHAAAELDAFFCVRVAAQSQLIELSERKRTLVTDVVYGEYRWQVRARGAAKDERNESAGPVVHVQQIECAALSLTLAHQRNGGLGQQTETLGIVDEGLVVLSVYARPIEQRRSVEQGDSYAGRELAVVHDDLSALRQAQGGQAPGEHEAGTIGFPVSRHCHGHLVAKLAQCLG